MLLIGKTLCACVCLSVNMGTANIICSIFFVFLVNLKTTLKKSLLIKKQSDMTCEIQDKAHPKVSYPLKTKSVRHVSVALPFALSD